MHVHHDPVTWAALQQRDAHRRQLRLVRESLVLRPPVGLPTHRRSA
jgi:hypothetical protein